MRFIIITLLYFYAAFANPQNNSDLVGTWKVISLSGDEVYFNLETDSSTVTNDKLAFTLENNLLML